eukprot:GHVS01034006.1.p1 GENE.GHVS01034006.1~~GHVS01034006.1.p1  ORF type:complete len:161 (-),score=9.66 GHVS01034006.1:45-527(-)
MYTVDLSLSGDKGGGHLLIRRHEFSERLAGSSNFRELDRTPVHLRTVLPLQMRLPPAVRNKAIFDEDLPTQCFEDLHGVVTAIAFSCPGIQIDTPAVRDTDVGDDAELLAHLWQGTYGEAVPEDPQTGSRQIGVQVIWVNVLINHWFANVLRCPTVPNSV